MNYGILFLGLLSVVLLVGACATEPTAIEQGIAPAGDDVPDEVGKGTPTNDNVAVDETEVDTENMPENDVMEGSDGTPAMEEDMTGYTMEEVSMHDAVDSCWTTVDGKVYDVTAFVDLHPGGAANVLKLCGTDGTEPFTQQHGSSAKAQAALEDHYIGDLEI